MDYKVIKQNNKEFPEQLKNIPNPPKELYVKGEILPQDNLALAVVGTRKCSSYGKEATFYLVEQLAQSGLTIVSGMARGIDSFAHQAAIEAGGRTIAVLGSGFNLVMSSTNRGLFQAIIQHGVALTEFPPDFFPTQWSFPVRNRLISGLSLGVLVIEAGEKSGALITARHAAEQGREVFALPGSIFSQASIGTLELIKSGAKLVRTVDDILSELNLEEKSQKLEARKVLPENKEEKILLELLEPGIKHIDELVRESGLSAATVASVLSMMEIKGMVKNTGAMEYRV